MTVIKISLGYAMLKQIKRISMITMRGYWNCASSAVHSAGREEALIVRPGSAAEGLFREIQSKRLTFPPTNGAHVLWFQLVSALLATVRMSTRHECHLHLSVVA